MRLGPCNNPSHAMIVVSLILAIVGFLQDEEVFGSEMTRTRAPRKSPVLRSCRGCFLRLYSGAVISLAQLAADAAKLVLGYHEECYPVDDVQNAENLARMTGLSMSH
ncbi:hypothetical protein LshimejAT787_1103140 [Lyophyllum shimeji]|uniref:Uncharacterized protein n=1 Tax=Lyophyllum shimeji TaxID=47721 RepID=A0A9P3PVJ2_LYOSH|nr:hypothetical protein LshimejAT787_1103140 [Lyophyllum shimeji]